MTAPSQTPAQGGVSAPPPPRPADRLPEGFWSGQWHCPPVAVERGRAGTVKMIYEYTADDADPLTCFDGKTRLHYRRDRHSLTDKGSIPALLRPWYPESECERAYLFHDSAYEFRGLWVARSADAMPDEWRFQPMTRGEADDLLGRTAAIEMYQCLRQPQDVALARAARIHAAVSMFGGFVWRRRSSPESVRKGKRHE
jgi:hypothetical protein